MSRFASLIVSALLALCESPSFAQSAPPSDSLVERFMAALPPDRRAPPTAPRTDEVERLEALNPGKTADIRPIVEAYQACTAAESKTHALALLRDVARALGEAKLLRLTSFYEGSDYVAFAALGDRISKGADV